MARINRHNLFLTAMLVLLAGAAGVNAYTPPSTPPPGDNNEKTAIDISAVNQLKNGGLSVDAFVSRGVSTFAQKVTVNGFLRGGEATSPSMTVAVGSNMEVNGALKAKEYLQSDTLANQGQVAVCGDVSGNVVPCGPAGGGTPAANEINVSVSQVSCSSTSWSGGFALSFSEPLKKPLALQFGYCESTPSGRVCNDPHGLSGQSSGATNVPTPFILAIPQGAQSYSFGGGEQYGGGVGVHTCGTMTNIWLRSLYPSTAKLILNGGSIDVRQVQ